MMLGAQLIPFHSFTHLFAQLHILSQHHMECISFDKGKGEGKGSCLESRYPRYTCSSDVTFPLARLAPMQPATIDSTLDLCTRYPLRLGGPRQCGIQSLPDTSTIGQHWESNPRPSDQVQCPIHKAKCSLINTCDVIS